MHVVPRFVNVLRLLLAFTLVAMPIYSACASEGEDHFERHIRPLLIERCYKCHSGAESKGGLRLDSREAAFNGGESGAAIDLANAAQSLLLQAIRHENGLEMPPDGKLSAAQIDAVEKWIREGALWPGSSNSPSKQPVESTAMIDPKQPNAGDLASSLQLWLRADAFQLADGENVSVWPDQSGHGRDLSATKGIREGGVGGPGNFIQHSTLIGRPAVRFSPWTGLASSPGNQVDIRGDAALTISMVVNLAQFESHPTHASVFCVGNPAHGGDPGKPLAALIEIDQTQQYSLDFAGGWGHDAMLGPGSFQPLFGKPVLLTFVKQPGPIKDTTRFYINGKLAAPFDGQSLIARDGIPDIQHRTDIGVFLGKALSWCGPFQGDIGEVVLYNTALSDADRLGVEMYLGEKYGLWVDEERTVAKKPEYTEQEKGHWAYQPLRPMIPPAVRDESWVRTPIDRFTLAAFESTSSTPLPELDKRSWLRRATLDLTGLPPTPHEVDEFLADSAPEAYEKIVDRLLNSPHYGERWGRHWLDLVRYAESTANDANAVMQYAWRYRNYVIEAFNQDLPYDQFLIEQLAGDLLPPTDSVAVNTRRVIATGYLMIGPKALAETDKEQSRLDIVDDQIDVTGRAMLGLTLACARCHDHKFDAIRTADYYALAGIFRSTEPFQNEVRNATMWWEFPVPQGAGLEPLMVMAPKETQPRNLRVHLRGNRFTLGRIVPRGPLGILDLSPTIDPHQMSSGRLELARWIANPANPLTPRVLVNRVWQLHFGRGIVGTPDNFGTRGELPSDPDLLDWLASQFIEGGWSVKQLHRLIVLSNTYRMANSRGPLRGPTNATTANPPSSAEPTTKLDHGVVHDDLQLNAPYFVHRRRLSAEELRDAMLMTSDQLDLVPGKSESGDYLLSKSEDISAIIRPNRVGADDEFYTTFRKRSVYLPIVRNMLPDVLSLFDAADPNGVTATRNETTVALQGLFLLNHPFVRQQANAFAERLLEAYSLTDEQRIDLAHRLAYGRSASPNEQQETQAFLTEYIQSPSLADKSEIERRQGAWQSFCQSILCSNEFLYVE